MEPDLSTPAVVVTGSVCDGVVPIQGSANAKVLLEGSKQQLDREFVGWLEPRFDYVVRFAYFQARDPDLAASLVGESVRKLYVAWHKPHGARAIQDGDIGYVWKVVLSAYRDYLRRCARDDKLVAKLGKAAVGALRWAMGSLDIETVWSVRDAIMSLDDQERLLITLVYYEGMNVTEAGRVLNLGAQKAHRHHKNALTKLGRILAH